MNPQPKLTHLQSDIRHAWYSLRHDFGFSIVAIALLAVGIRLNVAAFT